MTSYKYHYVYRITNIQILKFYIGKHSTNTIPELDIGKNYFSNSTDKTFMTDQKENHNNYQYEVIGKFTTSALAIKFESYLHYKYKVKDNPRYYNLSNQTEGGFDVTGIPNLKMVGTISAKDKNGNNLKVKGDDPRWLSGELVGVVKGKAAVVDKKGNTFMVHTNDPKYISGELVSVNFGKVNVRDKNGLAFQVPTDDPRYISGELVSATKGTVNLRDKNGNSVFTTVGDPRYISGELQGHCVGKFAAKDSKGNIFHIQKDDPRYISGELKAVAKGRITVKDKNGNKFGVSVEDPRYISGELVHHNTGLKIIFPKERCPICGRQISKVRMKYHQKSNKCKEIK